MRKETTCDEIDISESEQTRLLETWLKKWEQERQITAIIYNKSQLKRLSGGSNKIKKEFQGTYCASSVFNWFCMVSIKNLLDSGILEYLELLTGAGSCTYSTIASPSIIINMIINITAAVVWEECCRLY